jgi:Tfp pilus assembly protein PilW
MVTRVGSGCAMVVMAVSLREVGWTAPASWAGGQHCDGASCPGSYEVTSAWLVVPCGAAARADRSTPRAQGHGPTGSGSTATTTAGSSQWANLKDLELANRPTTTLAEVADATEQGVQRVCSHEDLVVGFLAHTGLTLDP